MPSPRMNGMIGQAGTWSLPFWMEIFSPWGMEQVVYGYSRRGEGLRT